MAVATFLTACSHHPGAEANAQDSAQPAATAIDCAPAGAPSFRPVCALEKHGTSMTLRNPDGGFHRLTITQDGLGVAAGDGAEPVKVVMADPFTIEVTAGRDRYRLPATVKVPL